MLDLAVGTLMLAAFFYGIFTILIIFSTYTVLSSGNFTKGNLAKAAVTLTMYAVSTAHIVITVVTYDRDPEEFSVAGVYSGTGLINGRLSLALIQAVTYLPIMNYILSDAIVVWRVWLLCHRRRAVLYVPIVCFLATIVSAIVIAASDMKTVASQHGPSIDTEGFITSHIGDLLIWSLSAATNVWATSIVSFKAWWHSKSLAKLFDHSSKKTRAEKLMALLVESGVLYCFIWVSFLFIVSFSAAGFLVMDGIMPQIAGIYPTILIVLVNFGKTHFETDLISDNPILIGARRNIVDGQNSGRHSIMDPEPDQVKLRKSVSLNVPYVNGEPKQDLGEEEAHDSA
ncbi:uncharacterized protein STEHIDRAFT_128430 [Stereum hirsutum FP-91666 SS1]|uniref:uncharacterized protein n=1 Tax=Stereum hirsutum (strain FP-91666) TaxID=721885 RepID=UPI000440EFE9|nr:uncharacterized protein STEHIDRAFT_128430 [Stereum hirsutum FP-91666 SS1]EIM91598.1 hypothetical protein STEHIDRAFT_128430 [Stereum hirsutum FP-91666 SS1]